jgi:hypothetical protein
MIDVRTATRVLRLAWVLPLSLLSFAFYRVVRLALRPVRMASLRRRREVAGQWRLNATERDLKGLRLALMMTTGPRANPHAIIGVIGADQVLARAIPGAARSFEAVRDKRGLFYLCLHYYVFHALDHRDWLPAAFVEREFLPAGNPQTRFRFGAVRRGQSITLTLAPALLATHAVFFTLYNRHSFPVTWYPIADEHHTTAPCACAGFYLVRIQQLAAQAGRFAQRAM